MAKSSPRKSLKSLFSRSEANLAAPAAAEKEKDVDKTDGEKKKFKFPKLKKKSKTSSASEKTASENQQVSSAVELSSPAENREAWADNIDSNNKRFSLYATAPRSKKKELSYSELDLRKPKRFATFSFGLRKKKKKDEENISKSTFGIHSPGIEEQDETAQDFSQMELDQANAKMFSMSHPELDTSHTFDIPSPPPVATNQSDSYFTLLNQSESSVTGNTQTKAEEPLTNGSSLVVVHQDPGKAPIATIPELHLDDLDSSEEKAYNSYKIESDPSAPVTYRATTSAVDDQIVPNFPASQPPAELDTSDPKGGVFGSTSILQQSDTETDTADTESTGLTISNLEPDAPGTGFIITSNETLSLESVDSDIDGTNTESAHAPHNDVSAVSAAVADSIINGLGDNDILQQHNTEIETSVTKPTGAAILHHQLDAPVKADITTQNDDDEPSLGSVDSEIDATHAESALFPRSDNSALKTAVVDFTCNGPCDNHILKKSEIDTETLVTESTGAAISSHQLDAPGTADVTTQDNKPSLGSVNSGIDATNAESTTVPHIDNSALIKAVSDSTSDGLCDKYILEKSETETFISDCPTVTTLNHHPDAPDVTTQNDKPSLGDTAAVPNEVSISHTETSIPETTKTVTAASTDSSGKSSRPVNQEAVYGALYESLLPESFTSGVMSSLSKSPPQIHTEIRRLSAKSEPVMVKTFNECHTDTNLVYSRLPTSPGFDSAARRVNNAAGAYTNVNSVLSERKVISPRESSRYVYQASMTSGSHRDQDIYHRYLPSSPQTGSKPAYSNTIPYSELTHSHSEVKPGSFSDTVKSVPPIQSSAPPVSDYVTPHGTDTQITDSIRRVILVKESVTEEEGSTDTSRPSPVPEKMSAVRDLEIKTDTPALPARLDGLDGPLSPTYLSVGSDDGSAMEIYYSAEEDNIDSGEDETYSVAQREDVRVIDGVNKAVGLCEEMPEQGEVTGRWMSERDGGETRVVIVKVQNEGGKTGMEAKTDSLTGGQQQLRGQTLEARVQETGMPEFLVGNDAKNQEKESANQMCLQVKQEGQEEREEELPATPVQQVNKLMVCDFAPPSSELRGQGEGSEGNWSKEWETKDHLDRELQLPGQEIEYLACKDISPQPMHATSIHTRETDMITPKVGSEASKESSETYSNTTTGPVQDSCGGVASVTGTLTRCAELQSDATGIEHNRVPESSEWVDTITQHTDRTWMIQQQVAVELSAQNKEARCPDTEAAVALSERHEHPAAEAHLEPNQGSVTASTTSSQVFAAENQPSEADQESADKMNLGYSSLSTKLTLSSSKEDDAKQRFRKVSLISEDDTSEVIQDTVGLSKITTVTEVNGADPDSEYRWKNRFEGVSPYKLYIAEDSSFSDSLSYRMSDSYSSSSSSLSSSALPEATAYKYVSHAFSSASSSSPEEHITLSNSLNDRAKVYLSSEGEPVAEWKDEWRRSLVKQEEPAVAAGERERLREVEAEGIKTRWDSQPLHVSSFSSTHQTSYDSTDSFKRDNDDDSRFTGVFQATRVELVPEPAAPPSTPPASPDTDSPSQFEMDSLVHTLKSMGPSLMPRGTGLRVPAPPTLISSLPPIVEDAPSSISTDIPDSVTSPTKKLEVTGNPAQALNGLHTTLPSVPPMPTLPPDLGLKRNITRDTRSPLELMKQSQQDGQQPGSRLLNSPLRGSATNSIVMRRSSDSSADDLPVLNGNGLLPSTGTGSRLDNSVIFGSLRSSSVDQPESRQAHRSLFRTSSLPDVDHVGIKDLDAGSGTDLATSRFERFSFLLNSSSSASGSLSGADDSNARMSRPPQLGISSPPSSSPTRLLSPTGSIDLQKPLFTPTESPLSLFSQTQGVGMGLGNGGLSTPILQRSFSSEGIAGVQQTSLFNSVQGGSQFQTQEPEKNLALKYRAFPDAYLTKEKEHGKLNPRPGKMYIFDRPGMCGQRIEVRSDVIDATPWELEETISIRVIRGGWVLYEKPNFKGEKIALDEGDIELTSPFSPLEEPQQNGQKEGEEKTGEQNGETSETKPAKKFIIGSIRRAVRDYSVPEISLFPEENAEGKKVIFRDTSEDARIFGFPIKANSIIINAGLWLVYAHPFFQGVPRVLEVGGYSNPAAWGVEKPYVGSVHPLKVGEPRVENTSEPKMIVYEKPYFSGKSRTITSNVRDFMTRMDLQQKAFMYNVGSLKVLGGIWVGYEKEGYRGHQYLLEEGEFHDWRVWGGRDAEMRSVRVIRADLTEPFMVMYEQPEEHHEEMQEENSFEVTEAIPDVELFEYKTLTRSIHVLSGAWIAYSHVDFSGNQYILEKGFYNNCADWGAEDNRICSVQPILLAPSETSRTRNEVVLYAEPDFQGECHIIDRNNEAVSEKLLAKSCRVSGGSWVIYEHKQFTGNLFVLSEGDYPNLMSMGCSAGFTIRSIKAVPTTFCVPSISLFGLECLEGREITTDTEILNMVEQGFNNHILSVRVNSGWWVICEHGNYRGRQFLLEPIEITNWQKFSSLQTVGSMYPIRQKRRFFRIKNTERGHFMSVQGGVEELKSGRVVVSPEAEPMSDIWYYQDGFIKSKLAQTMSLQVMGNIEPGAKAVLWTETRQPLQTWTTQMRGLITSLTFPGMVLDVKGGKTYDKDHVVIMPENDERPSQQWEIDLL